MNAFEDWFARVFRHPRDTVREVREHDQTLDDVQTNAPPRQKQAKRRAPERK